MSVVAKSMKSLHQKTKTWWKKSATVLNLEGELEPVASQHLTVEVLPDNVLLDIFDFDRLSERSSEYPWKWHRLVHVCQRWRRLVFSSPRRLDLRLFCSYGTPVKETLGFWPALPIVMRYGGFPGSKPSSPEDEENLVAALHHLDRIHEINLTITGSLCDRLAAEMQKTMPSLETLRLRVDAELDEDELLLPDKFLGGSAPLLSVISLRGVAFPALPKLLLSASNLVSLELWNIPGSGYFSPEALVMALSATAQLKSFAIRVAFPTSHLLASNLRAPPSGRTVLPALAKLRFCGVNEYFEDIVDRIDTPLLKLINLIFFNMLNPEIPIFRFISRTSQQVSPTRAKIFTSGSAVFVVLIREALGITTVPGQPRLEIACHHWQPPTISQLSSQLSPLLSDVTQLDIHSLSRGGDGPDSALWVELLRPFDRVERLCVIDELVLDIARALQWVNLDPSPELLPALRKILLGRSGEFTAALEAIAPFVNARQLSRNPIRVDVWYGTRKLFRRSDGRVLSTRLSTRQQARGNVNYVMNGLRWAQRVLSRTE